MPRQKNDFTSKINMLFLLQEIWVCYIWWHPLGPTGSVPIFKVFAFSIGRSTIAHDNQVNFRTTSKIIWTKGRLHLAFTFGQHTVPVLGAYIFSLLQIKRTCNWKVVSTYPSIGWATRWQGNKYIQWLKSSSFLNAVAVGWSNLYLFYKTKNNWTLFFLNSNTLFISKYFSVFFCCKFYIFIRYPF